MKTILYQIALILITLLLSLGKMNAQGVSTNKKSEDGKSIAITNHGIRIYDGKKKKKKRTLFVKMHFDFGFNNVIDNTNYNNVPADYFASGTPLTANPTAQRLSENDLNLRTGKSINFNFWPLWFSQNIAKRNVQIESGLGFQFFNYRFSTKVKHSDDFLFTDPLSLPTSSARFKRITDESMLQGKAKNKLGVSYISVPLMLRFNTNSNKHGYGFTFAGGIIGSYKLKSWTKFYGEKSAGDYDIRDWMTQLSAEVGIPGIIKFYGTYSLQSMYNNPFIDRSPIAIGIRL